MSRVFARTNSMYTIIRGLDGKFYCQGKLQDSTERWEEADLEAAIKSMKRFAKTMNGEKKLKKKGILFLQEQAVIETKLVPWNLLEE